MSAPLVVAVEGIALWAPRLPESVKLLLDIDSSTRPRTPASSVKTKSSPGASAALADTIRSRPEVEISRLPPLVKPKCSDAPSWASERC